MKLPMQLFNKESVNPTEQVSILNLSIIPLTEHTRVLE